MLQNTATLLNILMISLIYMRGRAPFRS